MPRILIVLLLCAAAHAASISSFTVACYSGGSAGTNITCPNGDDIQLRWTASGSVASIDQGIGTVTPVASGTYKVAWTKPPSGSVTYTLTVDGITAQVAVTFDDYYARVASWATTKRALSFETDIACNGSQTLYDPVYSPPFFRSDGGNLCTMMGRDTSASIAGASSYKQINPPIGTQDIAGNLIFNFSSDGSWRPAEGDEWYMQWREKMSTYYLQPYLGGSACPGHLTLSNVAGTFTVGETVTTSSPANSTGQVAAWSGSTLWTYNNAAYPYVVGSTITGASSGAHGTISANLGAGTGGCVDITVDSVTGTGTFGVGDTVTQSPESLTGTVMLWAPTINHLFLASTDGNWWRASQPPSLYRTVTGRNISANMAASNADLYSTSMKQIMFDPQDAYPLPRLTSEGIAPNCIGNHLVLTLNNGEFGQMYQNCLSVGGYEPFTPKYFASEPSYPATLLQSAVACPYTTFPPDVPASPPCVVYTVDEWLTHQVHVTIGHWHKIADPGWPNAKANFSGGALQSITFTDNGHDWPTGVTVDLNDNTDSFVVARRAAGGSGAHATCPTNNYGQIVSCTVVSGGSGYSNGAFEIRWPAHHGGNFRRDSHIERWQAKPGQPSVLVESMPYYDIVNSQTDPQEWDGGTSNAYLNYDHAYGKVWWTNYMTGRDPNAGPYPEVYAWIDAALIGTAHFPDPGAAVQPPTNLTISKASYPHVVLTWERNKDDHGNYNEDGFTIQRCAGQLADCTAGSLAGKTWSTAGTTLAGVTTFAEDVPNANQVYTYRVYARVGTANSAYSNSVVTAILPPTDLKAYWNAGHPTLTWTQQDDVGSFLVERCDGVFQYRVLWGGTGQYADDSLCLDKGYAGSLPASSIAFVQKASGITGVGKGNTATWTDPDATLVPGTSLVTYRVKSYYGTMQGWRDWNATYSQNFAATANVMPTQTRMDNSTLTVTTTCPLLAGTRDASYSIGSHILTASGGITPYTWHISAGALPAGLGISGDSIVGTPTGIGPSNFTLRVTDSASATATQSCSLTINEVPSRTAPTITTTSLPHGTVGVAYSQTLQATGTPATFTWTLASGTLAGCNLTLEIGGAITGTPSTATTCTFTASASNGVAPDASSESLQIAVDAAPATVVRVFRGGRVIRSAVH